MNVNLEDLEGYQGIKKFARHKGAFISLSYQCQCHCKHCGVALFRKKNAKELTTEEIKSKILDRLKDCGVNVAYFFGGEPTLHKDFLELIRYSTEKGLYSCFDTNGLKLADRDFVKAIKDSGITFLLVSIDSADAKLHDQFRGMPGCWKAAVEGIKNCVEMKVPVGISTVATKQGLKNGDVKRIIQLGKDLGVFRIRLLSPMMVGRWYRQDFRLSKEEMKEFKSLLEPNFVFWEEWCDGTVPFVCSSITRWTFAISVYGDVQPCCYIPVRFGNIREEDLKNIVDRMWNSSYFRIERENINKCDCPMNDDKIRNKILKLTEGNHGYPADYDESIFNANK